MFVVETSRTCLALLAYLLSRVRIIRMIGQTNAFEVLPQGYDSIVESHTRRPATEFVNFETGGALGAHIQALAVALRRHKYMVFNVRVHCLYKVGVQLDSCSAAG